MQSKHLQAAVAMHRAGNLVEAEAAYRRVLDAEPANPDALHFLGLIAHQAGRLEEAADLISRAIAIRPGSVYWYNIGHVHIVRGDKVAAEEAFRQAIALDAAHSSALFHVAKLRHEAKDSESAAEFYRRAIATNSKFVDAHVNLALLLHETGNTLEAVSLLEQLCGLRATDPHIRNVLGIIRQKIAPQQAMVDFRRVLALDSEHASARINLARLLSSEGQYAEVINLLSGLRDHNLQEPDLHMLLGVAYSEANKLESAVQHFRLAATEMPSSARPLVSLGKVYLRFGRFVEAYESYRSALRLDPANVEALAGIFRHLTANVTKGEAEEIASLLENPDLPIPQRRLLHFALSAYMDENEDYDAAFLHMDQGNLYRRMELEAEHGPYDPARQVAQVDKIIKTFDEAYFRRVTGTGNPAETPVFVVGMPRSGTTLCEQILSSHSQVFGGGEREDISRIARELEVKFGSQANAHHSANHAAGPHQRTVSEIADAHLNRLRQLAPQALRIVDKTPSNYQHLGVIATLFPNARIIHCSRDPMDIGLSCYSKDFAAPMRWNNDLRLIGQQYRDYDRLMHHWRRALPIEILEFPYEEVVAHLEDKARRLIEFCRLPWEPACLDFYRTERKVKTASLSQVRQPIYHTSVGRWRNYERHLTPLRRALDEPWIPRTSQ